MLTAARFVIIGLNARRWISSLRGLRLLWKRNNEHFRIAATGYPVAALVYFMATKRILGLSQQLSQQLKYRPTIASHYRMKI